MATFMNFKRAGKDLYVNPAQVRTVYAHGKGGTVIMFSENHSEVVDEDLDHVVIQLGRG